MVRGAQSGKKDSGIRSNDRFNREVCDEEGDAVSTQERKPHVALCLPSYSHEIHAAIFPAVITLMNKYPTMYMTVAGSLLAYGCNQLWCMARAQKEADIFMMLHADVVPQQDGLVRMVEEFLALGADVLSAVVPIKNPEGLTSTAIGDPSDEWVPPRRLTMHEVMALPETFCSDDVEPGKPLLVNTGLMLANLRRPWVKDAYFTIRDKIIEVNGELTPLVIPEDWGFSRMVYDAGGAVYATRKVKVQHIGHAAYPNDHAWGASKHDDKHADLAGKIMLALKEGA